MSELKNPFEEAMKASEFAETGFDPFTATSDPFGEAPQKSASPAGDLCSQVAANPFETPEEVAAGSQEAVTPITPIINLGNHPGAASPFDEPEQAGETAESGAPAKEIGGGQLTVLSPLEKDEAVASEAQSETPESENPLAAAMEKQEQQSIYAKPPIFEHGVVKEPIENLEQTFEDLRIAKAEDFPELEDGIRVSWNVAYGKISKSVPTPKKTKIGEFKKSIETSKEFMDALKKDKNKSPDCIIKPRINAQSKGDTMPSYKGVFTNLEDAEKADKVISIVPARDGKVYEIRREEMGTFITPSGECKELSEITAGFTPALPHIPRERLLEIMGFFRSLIQDGQNYEAIVNIYWDRKRFEYITVIPKQRVTAVRADSELSDDYCPARYLHYMDVHSHNVMPARFSSQDDRDEKSTRLYTVIGKLDKTLPEMSVRISNGGKHLLIDPDSVFESAGEYLPVPWNKQGHCCTAGAAEKLVRSIIRLFEHEGAVCA